MKWLLRLLSGHPETRRDWWQDWQGRFIALSHRCAARASWWRKQIDAERKAREGGNQP